MKDGEFMKKVAATVARNRSKRAFDRSMMHPEREWFLCLSFLLVGMVAAIFWSVTNYTRFSGTAIISEAGDGSANIYKGEMVTAALTLLETRATEYNSLKNDMMSRRGVIVAPEPTPEPEVQTEAEVSDESTVVEEGGGEASVEPEVEPVAEPAPVLEEEVVAEVGI